MRSFIAQEEGTLLTVKCPACKAFFKVGEEAVLIAIGPGDDEGQRKKRDEGRPYTAVAIAAHWDCVSKEFQ